MVNRSKHAHSCPPFLKGRIERSAFIRLCDLACRNHDDGSVLNPCIQISWWLMMLHSTKEPDRLHTLNGYTRAFGELTRKDVQDLRQRVPALVRKIDQLRRSPIVCELRACGRFRKGDLLGKTYLQETSSPTAHLFEGIIQILDLSQELLGNPKKPKRFDYDTYLNGLYETINQHTGHWHDALVAKLLEGTYPDVTEQSVKDWRAKRRKSIHPPTGFSA